MTIQTADYALGTANSEVKISNNDGEIQVSYEDGWLDTRLPNGNLVRFSLYQRKHWTISYSWIYGERKYIYDGGMGRNDLLALYVANNEMSFIEPSDQGASTSYTVRFVPNTWKEDLLFRNYDRNAYHIEFELVQVR